MIKIIKGIKEIVNFIKELFVMIGLFFEMIFNVFRYLIVGIQNIFTIIGTLPTWLTALATLSIAISITYLILGRNGGKSE